MKISKNSWHYKFYKSAGYREPTETCGYISSILLSIFILTLLTILVSSLLYTYFTGIYAIYLYGFDVIPTEAKNSDMYRDGRYVFVLVNIVILIIGLSVGATISYQYYKTKKQENDYEKFKNGTYKEHSTFVAIVWDKFKNKVCHKIEIVDSN